MIVMEINYDKLIASIRKYLSDNDITQEEFAARCNLTQGSISMYLTGKRNPDKDSMDKILDVLDLPDEEFIQYKDSKPASRYIDCHLRNAEVRTVFAEELKLNLPMPAAV